MDTRETAFLCAVVKNDCCKQIINNCNTQKSFVKIIIIYLFKVHRDKQLQWCMLIEQDMPGYI